MCVILEGICNRAVNIGKSYCTSSVVEVVSSERSRCFLANKTSAVDVLCNSCSCLLYKKFTELCVCVVNITCFNTTAKVLNSYILRIVSVCVLSCRDELVGRIVLECSSRTAKYNRRNITVLVVGNIIIVMCREYVIALILKAVLPLLGIITEKVARSIICEGLFGSSCCYGIFYSLSNYSG